MPGEQRSKIRTTVSSNHDLRGATTSSPQKEDVKKESGGRKKSRDQSPSSSKKRREDEIPQVAGGSVPQQQESQPQPQVVCPQALSPHPRPQDCINTTPFRSIPAFLSREAELETLSTAPLSQDRSQRIDVAITGPAGVGKTELTLKFIEDNAARFDHVLWISSENETSIYNSFINIAHELKINEVPHSVSDFELLVKTIYKTLTPYNCLLVFDNVDIDIQICFPPMGVDRSKLLIVVTSQFTEWPCHVHLPLQCFSDEVSGQLLESQLGAGEQTQLLAGLLGHLPLALQTAVLYVKHQRQLKQFVNEEYTVEEFVSELTTAPDKFLNYEPANYGNYNKPLSVICDLAKGVISKCKHGELALKLLNIMSFLKPDHIKASTLQYIHEVDMNEALLLLKNYSLVENTEKIISINPITQLINQNSCNTKNVLTEILTAFNSEVHDNVYPYCFQTSICNQTLYIWKFACNFDDLVGTFCRLFLAAARHGKNNEKSLSITEEQNKVLEKVCLWSNSDFRTHKMFQILMLLNSGQYEKVLDACEKFFADAKPFALGRKCRMRILHLKSCALFRLQRFEEAWELCDDVYNIRCDYEGRKNKNTLDSLDLLCKIACKFDEQGQKDKLESLKPILEVIFDNDDWDGYPGMVREAEDRMKIVRETMKYCLESGEEKETLGFFTRLLAKLQSKLESPHILIELATIEKSKCLLKLGRHKIAWDMVIALKDGKDGYSDEATTALCDMICKLPKKLKLDALQTCVDSLQTKLTAGLVHGIEKTLKNIETLEEYLHAAGKDAVVLELYSSLHAALLADNLKVDHPEALRALMYKALYLCDHEGEDEAWQIYEYVCELKGCEPQHKPDTSLQACDILYQFKEELVKAGAISYM